MPAISIANRALSCPNYQSLQQESQGTDFQERWHCLSHQKTHGDDA